MIKLLNAGFTRLKKDKLFWGLTVVVIGFALIMLYNAYSDMLEYGGNVSVDEYFFNVGMLIGFAIAIFASVYLGNEYSNGTLRNKIVMGHNRIKIYLSNLIIVSVISVFWVLLFDFVTACIGIPLFGNIQMDIGKFLLLFVIILLLSIAFASIFTFIAMVCSNKTATSRFSKTAFKQLKLRFLVPLNQQALTITIIRFIFTSAIRTDKSFIQDMAALTDPAFLDSRNSKHQGMVFDIPSHHSTSTNHCPTSNRMATHDCGVSSNGCTFLDYCPLVILVSFRVLRPRSKIVCKDTRWAAEHMIFEFNAFIHRNVVLNLYTVSNSDIVGNIHVLTKRTVLADSSTGLDMTEMPDSRSFPNDNIAIHITALMDKIIVIAHLSNSPLKSNVEQSSSGSFTGFPVACDL